MLPSLLSALLLAVACPAFAATPAPAPTPGSTPATAPAALHASDLHVDLEIDPTAYVFAGHSLHAGIGWKRLRVDLGAFAMDVPELLDGDDGFDSAFSGYGVKLQAFPLAEQKGLFVGVGGGVARARVTREGTQLGTGYTTGSVGAHVGWRFPLPLGLYVSPWVGVDRSFGPAEVKLGTATHPVGPWTVFPAVHLGYRFL